jgi:CO dehydrogenase maturation factor
MKIAVTGKGGVGKSTVTAALALLAARRVMKVLAIDADPDANLAAALGIPPEDRKKIVTIAREKRLIEERTGAKVQQYGQIFKLNPEVSDITDTHAFRFRGVDLLVLGAIASGGSGCACPESVLLKSLVQDVVLHRDEALFMDMEPGIEHLGRATARGVTSFIVVVEPGQRSIDSYRRIAAMAGDIGIKRLSVVGNKIRAKADEELIRDDVGGDSTIIGFIPFTDLFLINDRDGRSAIDGIEGPLFEIFSKMLNRLL